MMQSFSRSAVSVFAGISSSTVVGISVWVVLCLWLFHCQKKKRVLSHAAMSAAVDQVPGWMLGCGKPNHANMPCCEP